MGALIGGLVPLILSFLLVAPSIVAGQSAAEKRAADEVLRLNKEAVRLYRAGKFAQAETLFKRALAIVERTLGPAHPEVAVALNNLAVVLKTMGDYAAARSLYERALAIDEAAYGPNHPEVATDLNNLAGLLKATGDYAAARSLYERALAILEQTLGPSHNAVATSLNNLALLLKVMGDYAGARRLYERALKIKEQVLGPAHLEVAASLNNLAALLETTGDFSAARPLYERALKIKEDALGPSHPDVAITVNNLAALLKTMGEYGAARPLYERALRINEQAFGSHHPMAATSLNNLAALLETTGNYGAARQHYERALIIKERALGPRHPEVATSLNNLAAVVEAAGDFAGARPLYERALIVKERALGPNHPDVATSLNNLAALLKTMGDYAGARPLYERALGIWERAQGSDHPDVALGLNNLAALLMAAGDTVTARRLFDRALAIREQALGPNHPDVATSLSNLATVLASVGDCAAARPLLERGLRIWEQALGPDHPDVAASLNTVASLLKTTGEYAEARSLYERARRIYMAASRNNINLDDEAEKGLESAAARALRSYVDLLAAIARDPTLDSSLASAELDAFVVAEQARSGSAQAALAKSGVRVAAGDPATGDLARRVQDLGNRRQALSKHLTEEYGKPTAQRNEVRLKNLQEAVERLDKELTEAVNRLNKAFPKYAELASPEPIDVASVSKLLHQGEALISYFTLKDRLLVWLVRTGKELIYKDIEVKKQDLTKLVGRVRTSLDQSANPNLAVGEMLPFDVAGSHELFELLVAPLRDQLSGVKHLIFVPDEVLLPIPFGTLVTGAGGEPYRTLAELYTKKLSPSPAELTDYAKLSWLAKQYAITVLPSATSLRALRQIPRSKPIDVEPLIAFGDPVLQGKGTRRGGKMLAVRGAPVSVDEIRELDRLLGTREELLAVAKALGADPNKALYLDRRATKPTVVSLNASGRLGKAQVVSFATHGLIAGEVKGLKEPALVLTPPQKATEKDNGLLGLEDILGLELGGTDWVVLSACNTAAADGSGEGLAGLVRAFFFAGAPSLLVSHWSVDDRATQALMTEVFRRYAEDKRMARSEALRQGVLALTSAAGGPQAYFAHPYAWAPFFLVGEGGGTK